MYREGQLPHRADSALRKHALGHRGHAGDPGEIVRTVGFGAAVFEVGASSTARRQMPGARLRLERGDAPDLLA
jgi:hypothetical protein